MMPERAESPQQAQETQTQQTETYKLADLVRMEPIVNLYAQKIAHQYGIPAEHWTIHLVHEIKQGGSMAINPGPVVRIYILWPAMQGEINAVLRSAFDTIRRHKLRTPVEIVPYAFVRTVREGMRKTIREKYGDESEVIFDLLPETRIRYERCITVRATDIVTGASTEVKYDFGGKPRTPHDMMFDARVKLSQIIRDLNTFTLEGEQE